MESVPKDIKEKTIRLILALQPEAKIYLFGSRAKGTYREFSDIDLALDVGKKLRPSELDEVKSVLAATNIMYKFDVLDFNNVDATFRASIEKERVLWTN